MSFSGSSKDAGPDAGQDMLIKRRFISETELEEVKKKREEEWRKAKEEGREISMQCRRVFFC